MAKELTIDISANTDNLSAKLKAIAKHAEALANELDEIDEIDAAKCNECGRVMDTVKLHADKNEQTIHECSHCDK